MGLSSQSLDTKMAELQQFHSQSDELYEGEFFAISSTICRVLSWDRCLLDYDRF